MTEPILFGFPITLLFLYFIFYSFLGWVMETTYCSVVERRFVARGFLYGPICPIYGVGVLMMICWFAPFQGNPLVFYLVSVVCMSAWEYLVGWFLETTTHIKYWDYSDRRWNLRGRVCLSISLTWGVLSYIVIFWIHPAVAGLFDLAPPLAQRITALSLLVLLAADAAATIRELALVTRLLGKLEQMGGELQVQLVLGRAELSDRLDEARDALGDRLDEAKENLNGRLDETKENLAALREKYDVLLARTERASRHLRYSYSRMSSKRLSHSLSQVAEASRRAREERAERKAAKKSGR